MSQEVSNGSELAMNQAPVNQQSQGGSSESENQQ